MSKVRFITILQAILITLTAIFVYVFLNVNIMLDVKNFFKWFLFWWVLASLLSNALFSNKFCQGVVQEWLFYISSGVLISSIISYILFTIIYSNVNMDNLKWVQALQSIININVNYYGIVLIVFIGFSVMYFSFFDKQMLKGIKNSGLKGNGKLNRIDANLENSRWMNKAEREKIFKNYLYSGLDSVKKDGVPVLATLKKNEKDMDVALNSPAHSLIIGSTGSGKTTTFVNPMIQILASTSAGSSMIMTDPKGELFSLHSAYLKERGYDVKVIDLRDTYQSYRWNPLDSIYDMYEEYRNVYKNAFERTDDFSTSGLQKSNPNDEINEGDKWYEFNNKAYKTYEELVLGMKIYKKQLFDEVYESLNDLVSVLIPVENEKDPMWEKGARAITLAVLLAMLEDSEVEELNMTKDKFNFFNLTKILQNSNQDYLELRKYFQGRSPLSKALSLSKQVCDAAESTRASYMSVVYEKLTLFNDSGICGLTSKSDFTPKSLSDRPTALFLKIPDEKTTRHNLAAIFILDLYKSLIKVASSNKDLSLPRNVYFILDEFGNMPKIENFDKMITVGRSRKIWFNMIIQSYQQLNNVYGDKVADVVKGNCGIKMFIGSNDISTCKEFSELCGNITVVTRSTSQSGEGKGGISSSSQTQVRPLIYPSELQRLNKQGDIGNAIIVTFGNYPLKTFFTPSFKVPFYKIGQMDTSELNSNYFDENEVFYDITKRNSLVFDSKDEKKEEKSQNNVEKTDEKKEDNTLYNEVPLRFETEEEHKEAINETKIVKETNKINDALLNRNLDFLMNQLKLYQDVTNVSNDELLNMLKEKIEGGE